MARLARFLVLGLLLPAVSLAQVPAKLSYQGRLLKADGSAQIGAATVTFAIFDATTGGTQLWTENQTLAFSDGYYSTVLGDVNAIPPTVFTGQERYLELSIGGSALTPRQRIVSVPYAITAQSVAGASTTSGVVIEGEWTDTTPTPGNAMKGSSVLDPTASGGQVRWSSASNTSGTLFAAYPTTPRVNGPLGIALTRATFRLKVANNMAALGQVGTIKCGANRGGNDVDLATRDIRPSDFGASQTWTPFTLYCDFHPDDANQWVSVEFLTSSTDLMVDFVQLQPVGTPGVPAGTVLAFAGATPPSGFLICNGKSLERAKYPALFAAIGTTYGAADATHFTLPDAQGRTPVGAGQGLILDEHNRPLTNRALGATGGEEVHALLEAELATHSHTAVSSQNQHRHGIGGAGGAGAVSGDSYSSTYAWDGASNVNRRTGQAVDDGAGNGVPAITTTIGATGSGVAHNTMPPFLVLNWIIAY
jgi:microcystin-dependent protein